MAINRFDELKEGVAYRYEDGVLEEITKPSPPDPRFQRSVRISQGAYEILRHMQAEIGSHFREEANLSLVACAMLFIAHEAFKGKYAELKDRVQDFEIRFLEEDLEAMKKAREAARKAQKK